MNKILLKYKNLSIEKKAAIWAVISGIVQKGIGILVTPIFTRILTTDEYAQFTMYQSWHDIIIIFATLNVFFYCTYTALAKFEDDKEVFILSAQSFVSIVCLLFAIIFYLGQSTINHITHYPFPIMLLMIIDIMFLGTFNLWLSKERYEFRYRSLTALSVISGCLGPILSLIFVVFMKQNKGYGRIYGMALSNIFIGANIYIYNARKARAVFSYKYWKYILSFCIPLIPHFLSTILLSRFDRIMINEFCGSSSVALYSLAYSVASLMTFFNDALMKVLTPWTYKSLNNNSYKSIANTCNLLLCGIAILDFALILIAPEIIHIFAPISYEQSIYLIPPLSAATYFIFLFSMFANIEYYYSETKYVTFASLFASISNVVLNYVFIKKYGFIAAGYTTLTSYILYSIGHYIFMRRVIIKHNSGVEVYNIKQIVLISGTFVILSIAVIPLYKYLYIRYGLISILAIFAIINRKILIKILNLKDGGDMKND